MAELFRVSSSILLVMILYGCGEPNQHPDQEKKTNSESGGEAKTTESKSDTKNANSDKPVTEKLLGSWKGKIQVDDESFQNYAREKNYSKDEAAEFKKKIENSTHYYEFQRDGKAKDVQIIAGHSRFQDLTWKVISESGNKARIEFQEEGDSQDVMWDIAFTDDTTFTAKPVFDSKRGEKSFQHTIRYKKWTKFPSNQQMAAREVNPPRQEKNRKLSRALC